MTVFQEKTKIDGTVVVNSTLILASALIREVNPAKFRLVTGQIEILWPTFAIGSPQYIDHHNGTPGHKGVPDLPSLSISAAVKERTQ